MKHRFQLTGLVSAVCLLGSLLVARDGSAQVPLIRADVETLYNRVEYLPEAGTARPATLSDWLDLGDAIRTAAASRADLRFNDGSLARVGERATFWFVPNTRTFRLSNGTALFLVPPGRGPSTIETPNVVTGIQGTAVIVRHIPESASPVAIALDRDLNAPAGRTIVMALTNNPGGPVKVSLPNGQSVDLVAGQMAIATNNTLERLEFDLRLFYETSPLVADLQLDDPNYVGTASPTDPVRQETLDGLAQQANFVGDAVLNPEILDFAVTSTAAIEWQVPLTAEGVEAIASDRLEQTFSNREMLSPNSSSATGTRSNVAVPAPDTSMFGLEPTPSGQPDLTPGGAVSGNEVGGVGASAPPPGVVEPPLTVPAIPADPDDPRSPAVPAIPAIPGTPAIPAIPGEPGTPATPADPNNSDNPGNLDEADPDRPGAIPATPAVPGEPGTPATPAVPATPPIP